MLDQQLDIGVDADAVPTGRHFASSVLAGSFDAEVVDAAELVVTELLTNALLHGGPPVRLVVRAVQEGAVARIEVHDGSRALPIRPHPSAERMTGRGLALVDAVAADWGVLPAETGKVVWAEVTPESVVVAAPGDIDLETLLAAFDDDDVAGADRVTVVLGDVPTELLLAAEDHVDSVVRELALAARGAESGLTAAVPSSLALLVHDVASEFAEGRQAAKRQAVAAAAAGQGRTSLRLTLPPSAADAGERYLAAMEAADAYARSARLLTLAAPPQHAAFRRWYVTALVTGLREGAPAQSFESFLLEEVDHLAELRSVSDRAARLQGVSALLAVALDRDEVTRIALDQAVAELGATRGALLLISGDSPRVAAQLGHAEGLLDALVQRWEGLPGRTVARTGRPVWIESRDDLHADFPSTAELEPDIAATCALPLDVAGHSLGVLRLSFAEGRLFSDDERAFLTALAAVAAQALERADLYDAQAALADRLVRLQAVTSALTAAGGVDQVLDVAIDHATGLIGARRASICLLRDDGVTIDLARMVPPLAAGSSWWSFSVHDEVPASEAIRTGELQWVPDLATRDARWPAIADTAREFEHSLALIPLQTEGRVLGALSLAFGATQGEEPSREFLTAFGDVCAQALQRARTGEDAAEANRKLAFLARASAELSGELDVEGTLENLVRLAVPELADWCVLHLLQDDELVCVMVDHLDPVTRDRVVDAQRGSAGAALDPVVDRVVRSGRPLLLPAPDDVDGERQQLLEALGAGSAIVVPLAARGRTLGALSFGAAGSGRGYGPSELALAEDLSRRAAVAVDNARLYAVAAGPGPAESPVQTGLVRRPRAEALPAHADDAMLRWHLAQEAGRLGSWDLDTTSGSLSWDESCAALFGTSLREFENQLEGFSARTHPDDLPTVLAHLERTIDTGAPLDVEFRALQPDGTVRHLLSRGRRVAGRDGRTVRVVGAVVDVSDLREAASAESRAARVLAGLGDVALRLAAANTVEQLTGVVIERGLAVLGADGGAVCVRDDERQVVRLAVSDSLGPDVQVEFGELPLHGPYPASYTALTGETVLLPTEQSGLGFAPEMANVYASTGRRGWASLPLRAGGRLLGSLVVSWTDERAFTVQEEELLAAFAAQCAQALDRVQTLEAERRAATAARRLSATLQRSLLTLPPEPDHLEVAVRYVAASQEAQVGGDWYDAFLTPDGALDLVIGDCTGHDRKAVAAMATVRNLLRATAYAVHADPATVLTALEQAMAGLDVSALATALLARVEQSAEQQERGVRSLVWSNAGHLPPLLRLPDGSTEVLRTVPDLMLGLVPSTDRADHRIEVEPGATVLLYTDGLVERRGEDIDDGVERLRSAFAELGDSPLEQACDGLLARLGGDAEDDVALVAVRFHDETRPRPREAGPERVPDPRPLDR